MNSKSGLLQITLCLSLVLTLWLGLTACQQTSGAAAEPPGSQMAGAQLYQRLACHGCHRRQGNGGTVGPALDRLQERLSTGEVETQLLTPRHRRPDSRMPSFAFLRTEELQDLMAFLYGKSD
ncbi:MAG: c-type cytochrome [Desulfobacca sp.]|uniref:c-type cytochrome n=1 Tax=Desulfobacca sp. TaxID=2067990 RepID=UPI00404BA24E